MRDVVRVAQQQLQRVRARRQRQFDLRLTAAKVKMLLVVWDRLVQGRQIRVDKEMMVPRVRFLRSGRRDAHSMEPEMDRGLRTNHRAVLEIDELFLRARRRRGRAADEAKTRPPNSATAANAFSSLPISQPFSSQPGRLTGCSSDC